MTNAVKGTYYAAGSAAAIPVNARQMENGDIRLCSDEGTENGADSAIDLFIRPEDYEFGDDIPGLAAELRLRDGGLFEPHDVSFRWNLRHSGKRYLLAKLESNLGLVSFSVIAIPLFIWWMIAVGIPSAAERAVPLLPDSVSVSASEQTLDIMTRFKFLKPSKLEEEQQQKIRSIWRDTQTQLGQIYVEHKLLIKDSPKFGANAFALPDGTIVLTDDLVELLKNKEDALLAVLLHEQGHVYHQHGLKLAARSTATAIFFSLLLGDIQGIGELVIGASSSLLDSAFSRDMEREADRYSIDKLKALDKSPTAFSDAMESFLSVSGESEENSILQYLSTHPSTQERIESAKQANDE